MMISSSTSLSASVSVTSLMVLSNALALQLLAQREPSAMQARLHGAIGETGDLADLLDREVLDIAEHDHRALILVERCDRLLEDLLHLRTLECAIRRGRYRRSDR